jgi:NADH:ubiquinone reductase (H+-translocating)
MSKHDKADHRRPRVVVLGGGFAGIGAARKLKKADADVVLIDKHDYHTFQPMLYQLATGVVDRSAVAHPLRDLFHDQQNAVVHQDTVRGVDLEKREIQFKKLAPLTYDYLVLALGAGVNFFGTHGASDHGFPMYTLADAVRLEEHVIRKWEEADRSPSLVEDGALNIVIVGGGPTGVETAGAMAELYNSNFAKDYPNLPADSARITLVEASPSLFAMFEEDIRTYTHGALTDRNVDVVLGEIVDSVTATRVNLKSGKELRAHTLVWGAGLKASPVASSLGAELERGGRIRAQPDLSLSGHPEVFPVGDVAWITDTKTGDVLPQLGSVALQAGERAGKNIKRLLRGKPTKPFEYLDKGTMATIGRGAAVIQFPHGRTMKGKMAFLAWGAVHLALLSTGEDRAKAIVDWTWAGITHDRSGRIAVDLDEEPDEVQAERPLQEARR